MRHSQLLCRAAFPPTPCSTLMQSRRKSPLPPPWNLQYRENFPTTAPSPRARQTAPPPADCAHPSPPGSRPQTPRPQPIHRRQVPNRIQQHNLLPAQLPRPVFASLRIGHSLRTTAKPLSFHQSAATPQTGPDAVVPAPSARPGSRLPRTAAPSPPAASSPRQPSTVLPADHHRHRPIAAARINSVSAGSPPRPHVILQIPRRPNPFRPSPHLHQPLAHLLALRQKERNPSPQRPPPIALTRISRAKHRSDTRAFTTATGTPSARTPPASAATTHSPSTPASPAAKPADTPSPPTQNPAVDKTPAPNAPRNAPAPTPALSP